MQIKDYIRPVSLRDACELYESPGYILFAGGTDLMVKAFGKNSYKDMIFLDIGGLKELQGISLLEEKGVKKMLIGAGSTLTEILESRIVRDKLPLLYRAVKNAANTQVRNRATIGGNIANACPAADCIPPLMVMDAEIIVENRNGERSIKLSEFYTECKSCLRHEGMLVRTCFYTNPVSKKLTLLPGEIIRRIEIPLPEETEKIFFIKLTPNRSSDMAVLNLAMAGSTDTDGRVKNVRLCMGGVFPKPVCLKDPENILTGNRPDRQRFSLFAEKTAFLLNREKGVLADYEYKRQAAPALIEQGLEKIFA